MVCQGSYYDDVTGSVHVINTRTLQWICEIPVGVHPRWILINGNRAYVVNHGNFLYYGHPTIGTVSVINIRTATLLSDPIEVGREPEEIAVSGSKVYVANTGILYDEAGKAYSTVSVISTATNTLLDTIVVAPGPTRVIVAP